MGPEKNMGPFLRVMNRLSKLGHNSTEAQELTRGEFFCLGAICGSRKEEPEKGGIYVWELARRTHVHPPAVSRTLRDLEKRALIARTVDTEDRRNIRVCPTEEGLALWARAEKGAHAFAARVVERMGTDNMNQLVELCDRLCDIIEEEQQKKP